MTSLELINPRPTALINVAIKCPHCGHQGTFKKITDNDVASNSFDNRITHYFLGIRKCPNDRCNGQVFFIANKDRNIIEIHPSNTIDFDSNNIPDQILETFKEAIQCHSIQCYKASAIMIRRTLEEICKDNQATGSTLYERIEKLKSTLVIPVELLTGLHDLRLLGNDAAHIEANTYNEIGKDEVEISIDITKEILKGIYQYDELIQKLKNLQQ